MTPKQLLLQALQCRPTPRPAWVPFVGVHGAYLIGQNATEYLKSADSIVAGLTEARKRYRPDGLPIIFDLQLEAEVLGCELKWAKDSPPAVTSHPLQSGSLAELPAFETDRGRFPVIAQAIEGLREAFNDEIGLYGLITGPFTLTMHLMGNDLFLRMFDGPDAVKQVLDFTVGVCKQTADFYLERGADVIAVVDPMTSQISPAHFDEFVAAYVNDVFDHVRARGALSSLFVCGNASRNLEKMCQTRCDNVSIDENISLPRLRELAMANAKSWGGNLKLTAVLLLGDEDAAAGDALRCLDEAAGDGFVLAPGCDLPFNVPPENVEAVADIVHDEYQRDVARLRVKVTEDHYEDIELPDYSKEEKTIVDVVTLDSASCPPCQYMVEAAQEAARRVSEENIEVREHKIKTREGLGVMCRLSVGEIPTICIDGEVTFASIIPSPDDLARAIREKMEAKTAGKS